MSNLRKAIEDEMKWCYTENGADTLNTTGSRCLDLFAIGGSLRSADNDTKIDLFEKAFSEDAETALKLLFYIRDVRGGYGEKSTFTSMLRYLADVNPLTVENNLWAILEFGRAKDLYALIGTKAEDSMWKFMKRQFELDLENMEKGSSISLLAKWIATPDSKSDKTAKLGKLTAKKLGYGFKEMKKYRKKLRALRVYLDLPEAKMCSGKWSEIEYSKCSSRFILKFRNACERHDAERWEKYLEEVNQGKANMNMSTNTPYDILLAALRSDKSDNSADIMWKQLEDVCDSNALVMCDTSSSMTVSCSSARPIDVAVALTIYFAERNKGDLNNLFMTFNTTPAFIDISGDMSLVSKYNNIRKASWGGTTNLESAFDLLLKTAKKANLSNDDMPKALIIVSDMQINGCVRGLDSDNRMTFYETMSLRYANAGYKMPHVIFWNVNGKNPVFHASMRNDGVSLVSGYSTNVFKQVVDNIGKTPYDLMMDIVNSPRYSNLRIYT